MPYHKRPELTPIEQKIKYFLTDYVKRVHEVLTDPRLGTGNIKTGGVDDIAPVNCSTSLNVKGDVPFAEMGDEEVEYIILGIKINTPMSYYESNKYIIFSKIKNKTFRHSAKSDPEFDFSKVEHLDGKTAFIEVEFTGYGEMVGEDIIEIPDVRVDEAPLEKFLEKLEEELEKIFDQLEEKFSEVVIGIQRIVREFRKRHNVS